MIPDNYTFERDLDRLVVTYTRGGRYLYHKAYHISELAVAEAEATLTLLVEG